MGFLESEIRENFDISVKRKRIWQKQLELLNEIEKICNKHGLKYYASNGTLLGSVKYSGFIPWDDDLDITMPRPDYEEFKKYALKELVFPFYFQDMYTNDRYFRPYGRIRNSQTTAVAALDIDHDTVSGIFVDIFPLDGVSTDKVKFKRQIKTLNFRYKLLYKYIYRSSSNKVISLLATAAIKLYCLFFSYNRYLDRLVEIASLTNYSDASDVYYYSHGNAVIVPKNIFENCKTVPFEHVNIRIPSGYDTLLTRLYGNYMTELPPEEERGTHHTIFFDPDNPYSKYYKIVSKQELISQMNDY